MSSNLYLAKIVGECCTYTDGEEINRIDPRLQIKILPQMEGIADADCPKWPFFFKDQVITGKVNDLVWCICDDDFNIGYILGPANYNTYIDNEYDKTTSPINNKEIPLSIPGTLLQGLLDIKDIPAKEGVQYTNMKVSYWDSNSIHFVEKNTGGFVVAYSSGSILIMRPNRFFIHIGKQDSGSTFSIDSTGISLKGDKILLEGDYVGLGKNPTAGVLVTNGSGGEGAIVREEVKA